MRYQLTNDGAVIASDGFSFSAVQLRDGDTIMSRYFDGCYDLFMRELEHLRDDGRPFTEQDKRELNFLLQCLIHERETMDSENTKTPLSS